MDNVRDIGQQGGTMRGQSRAVGAFRTFEQRLIRHIDGKGDRHERPSSALRRTPDSMRDGATPRHPRSRHLLEPAQGYR